MKVNLALDGSPVVAGTAGGSSSLTIAKKPLPFQSTGASLIGALVPVKPPPPPSPLVVPWTGVVPVLRPAPVDYTPAPASPAPSKTVTLPSGVTVEVGGSRMDPTITVVGGPAPLPAGYVPGPSFTTKPALTLSGDVAPSRPSPIMASLSPAVAGLGGFSSQTFIAWALALGAVVLLTKRRTR